MQIVFLGVLFGLGAMMVITSQPIGRRRPTLTERLAALRPDRATETKAARPPVFKAAFLEELLRPRLEALGELAATVASKTGFNLQETEARLRVTGDQGGLALFYGQKLAAAMTGFALLPLASGLGVVGATPLWLWLALTGFGFVLPDAMLRSRAESARVILRESVARFSDLLSLAVSAGLGLEQAVDVACSSSEGTFFDELRAKVSEARMAGRPASSAVREVAMDLVLADAEGLAAAVEAAESQGSSITQALRAQARAIRERRRIELVEAGERSQVRMTLPVGLFIFPAFLVILLYPAAVQMLQITK